MKFNPKIEVGFAKKTKTNEENEIETVSFAEHAQIVNAAATDLGKKIVLGIVIVIAAQTVREVLVKVTPSR